MAKKTYTGSHLDVSFDADTCIHAGECVRGLPAVFDTKRKPWIAPDEGAADAIREVVARCPSGALEIVERPGAEPAPVRIKATERGHNLLYGAVSVVATDLTVLSHRPKKALFRCGKSANAPFCDGSHAKP